MNFTGPVPVPFLPAPPVSPARAAQPLQVMAVTGMTAASRTGAPGDHAPAPAQGDALARARPRATAHDLHVARIAAEPTPRERLAAALSELSVRQQARLQAQTMAERAQSDKGIAELRDMVAILRSEVKAGEPAEPKAR